MPVPPVSSTVIYDGESYPPMAENIRNIRAFLNIGMLLTESEVAKKLRQRILDIVIGTINSRDGGGTKYINWRDRDYLPIAIKSENY